MHLGGHGYTLCPPRQRSHARSNAELRHGLRRGLDLNLHGSQAQCMACKLAGEPATQLDQSNIHGAACRHVGGILRHNGVRDLLAEYSKRTHTQVTTEQRWPTCPRQADSQRTLTTADIHIQHGMTTEHWLDIRITTAGLHNVKATVGQAEGAKAREYGQEHVPRPGASGQHIIPMVFERDGAVTACTAAVLKWMWLARAKMLLGKGWY